MYEDSNTFCGFMEEKLCKKMHLFFHGKCILLKHFSFITCILIVMHNDFYASGFLYHPVSQKILLQQNSSQPATSSWTLFGTSCQEKDDPEIILKHVISSLLGIQTKKILPVYSYANEEKNVRQYIGYAIAKTKKTISLKNDFQFAWFSFKEILKLHIDTQTKHDIVVGQRVIEAQERKRLGLHTF